MKHIGKVLGKSLMLLLAGGITGTVLLTLAYLLPVNITNRDTSYDILEKEGWYPRATVTSQSWDTFFHSFFPDVLDQSSERIILYTSMDDREGNPLVRAMESYNQWSGYYNYYWHGYVSVLRPLFLLFDYTEVRTLNGVGQLLVVFMLAILISRKKDMRYVFMLISSYVLMSPFALAMSLQFTWIFYISYIGTLVLLLNQNFFQTKDHGYFLFMILGMCTSYFDLLTYPLLTWGIPLLWWIVMDEREKKRIIWVRQVVFTGFFWIAGYATMWITKWAFASFTLRQNVFETAIAEVFFRSGIQGENVMTFSDRLQAIYINWKHYSYTIFALILGLWILYGFCNFLVRGGYAKGQSMQCISAYRSFRHCLVLYFGKPHVRSSLFYLPYIWDQYIGVYGYYPFLFFRKKSAIVLEKTYCSDGGLYFGSRLVDSAYHAGKGRFVGIERLCGI